MRAVTRIVAVSSLVATTGSLPVFAVATGIAAGTAGLILAGGSVAGLVTRITLGVYADRRAGGSLAIVAGMMFCGGIVMLAFPLVSGVLFVTVATTLAYGVGWGWPGLLNLAIVQGNPHAPAAATGLTQVGAYVGGVAGPLVFGFVVSNAGYGPAWRSAAVWQFAAAAMILAGRARMRERPRRA